MRALLQELVVASVLVTAWVAARTAWSLVLIVERRLGRRRARAAVAAIVGGRVAVLRGPCTRMKGLGAETFCRTHGCAVSLPCGRDTCPHCGHRLEGRRT